MITLALGRLVASRKEQVRQAAGLRQEQAPNPIA